MIIVIEDDTSIIPMISNMLRSKGYEDIKTFEDARKALSFIKRTPEISLIICDWNMPSISGIEILEKSQSINPDVKFLMITGRSDADSIMLAKNKGVSAYIRKPFSPEQFHEKIKKIMRKSAIAEQTPPPPAENNDATS